MVAWLFFGFIERVGKGASTKKFNRTKQVLVVKGLVGLSELVKKENSWQKSFLQVIQNEVLEICEKWYLLM